ncbi:MAG: hypothetical protein CMH55_05000 [Myxococcales bacterium]|nr:hypothetical protein [Myxococcales bacterium]
MLLTLIFIFLTALVGIVLQRRRRDRCLKDFEAYRVTVEFTDGTLVWGRLSVFPQDIELFYPQPHEDKRGHKEYSYVLFAERIGDVQAIYRYHDELSEAHQAERRREIERTWRPSLARRTWRGLRNMLNTFGDAFNQSVGVWLSAAKKGGGRIVSSQDKHLAQIGKTVLGAAANAFEPVLERYIGRRVVIEELRGEDWVEHIGVLKEYTAQWIELLDCRDEDDFEFSLKEVDRLRLNRDLDFIVKTSPPGPEETPTPNLSLRLENHGTEELIVKRFEAPDYRHEMGALLPPGGSLEELLTDLPPSLFQAVDPEQLPDEIALRGTERLGDDEVEIRPDEQPALPDLRVVVQGVREVDRLLPRSRAVLRHGGEPEESWFESLRRKKMDP